MRFSRIATIFAALSLMAAQPALAGTAPRTLLVNSGDTAWVLLSAALVLLMTIPGLALFYGGMVRRKNVLSIVLQSFILVALVSVQWVLFGYSLAFGPDHYSLIGDFSWAGLRSVGMAPYPAYAATIPHLAFMIYQCMFAVITPALITGAFAERIKFSSFLIFSLLWITLIYDPLAHWVWGNGGWIHDLGALDFAGGTVVHISSGVSALAAAALIGKRIGFPQRPMPPHNLVLTITGAGLLWVGWFGFNAGSALAANGLAASAMVTTHIATSGAALSWLITEWISHGRPTALGAASGAVAGLVAITPAAGYVAPMPALLIGIIAGVICFHAVSVKFHFGYDDALDVVGVHGVGGATGALLTGIFASKVVNPAGADGWLHGNPHQFLVQLIAVAVSMGFAFVGTSILLQLLEMTIGLRVASDDERTGLDLAIHSEVGYALLEEE